MPPPLLWGCRRPALTVTLALIASFIILLTAGFLLGFLIKDALGFTRHTTLAYRAEKGSHYRACEERLLETFYAQIVVDPVYLEFRTLQQGEKVTQEPYASVMKSLSQELYHLWETGEYPPITGVVGPYTTSLLYPILNATNMFYCCDDTRMVVVLGMRGITHYAEVRDDITKFVNARLFSSLLPPKNIENNKFQSLLMNSSSSTSSSKSSSISGLHFRMTSVLQQVLDMKNDVLSDLAKIDMISIPCALVALAICVKSARLLLVPLLSVATSVALTFICLDGYSRENPFSPIAPAVIGATVVALSVDFSLFILTRFCEKRKLYLDEKFIRHQENLYFVSSSKSKNNSDEDAVHRDGGQNNIQTAAAENDGETPVVPLLRQQQESNNQQTEQGKGSACSRTSKTSSKERNRPPTLHFMKAKTQKEEEETQSTTDDAHKSKDDDQKGEKEDPSSSSQAHYVSYGTNNSFDPPSYSLSYSSWSNTIQQHNRHQQQHSRLFLWALRVHIILDCIQACSKNILYSGFTISGVFLAMSFTKFNTVHTLCIGSAVGAAVTVAVSLLLSGALLYLLDPILMAEVCGLCTWWDRKYQGCTTALGDCIRTSWLGKSWRWMVRKLFLLTRWKSKSEKQRANRSSAALAAALIRNRKKEKKEAEAKINSNYDQLQQQEEGEKENEEKKNKSSKTKRNNNGSNVTVVSPTRMNKGDGGDEEGKHESTPGSADGMLSPPHPIPQEEEDVEEHQDAVIVVLETDTRNMDCTTPEKEEEEEEEHDEDALISFTPLLASTPTNDPNRENSSPFDDAIEENNHNKELSSELFPPRQFSYSSSFSNSFTQLPSWLQDQINSYWFRVGYFSYSRPRTVSIVALLFLLPFAIGLKDFRPGYNIFTEVPISSKHIREYKSVTENFGSSVSAPFYFYFSNNDQGVSFFGDDGDDERGKFNRTSQQQLIELISNVTKMFQQKAKGSSAPLRASVVSMTLLTIPDPQQQGRNQKMQVPLTTIDEVKSAYFFPNNTKNPYASEFQKQFDLLSGGNLWSETSDLLLAVYSVDNPFALGSAPMCHVMQEVLETFETWGASIGPAGVFLGWYGPNGDSCVVMKEAYEKLPVEIGLAVGVAFLAMAVAFRSIIISLRMIITVCYTAVFAFGMGTFIFCDTFTHGLFTSLQGTNSFTWIIPVIVLPLIIALALDYDAFLLTRAAELRTMGFDNQAAVCKAVYRTGRVISYAGLIMTAAFGSLIFSSAIMLQQFGTLILCAVLCDAFLVRPLLVPALMALFPKYIWFPRCGLIPPIKTLLDNDDMLLMDE